MGLEAYCLQKRHQRRLQTETHTNGVVFQTFCRSAIITASSLKPILTIPGRPSSVCLHKRHQRRLQTKIHTNNPNRLPSDCLQMCHQRRNTHTNNPSRLSSVCLRKCHQRRLQTKIKTNYRNHFCFLTLFPAGSAVLHHCTLLNCLLLCVILKTSVI